MHKVQYPRLYPLKLAENEEQDIINSWIELVSFIISYTCFIFYSNDILTFLERKISCQVIINEIKSN